MTRSQAVWQLVLAASGIHLQSLLIDLDNSVTSTALGQQARLLANVGCEIDNALRAPRFEHGLRAL